MSAKFFLGPGGNCKGAPEPGTESSFRHLPSIGLNGQELEFVQNVYLKPEPAKKLGELAEQLGLRLSIHGSYYVNFCSPEKEKREASRKRILAACKIGELLGVKVVLFHPGFRGKQTSEQCTDLIVKECRLMEKETGVRIGLETAGKKGSWGTLDEIIGACKQLENTVPVVDWAHLYACNGGKIDYAQILGLLKKEKLRELHCHFEGVNWGPAGEKNHIPISSNAPPFAPLAAELERHKNDFDSITLISESPLLEQDSLVMKKELEKQGLKLG